MRSYAVGMIIRMLTIILFFGGVYYLAAAFFSFFPRRYTKGDGTAHSFAALIPAHNEENVLPELIESIRNAEYPQDKIFIYIVADNCSDRTADIAKKLGCYVIVCKKSVCKGDALACGFSYILKENPGCDYISVFDADNIVDKYYFERINEHFSLGRDAIQGYVESKNPTDSWVANAHSIWYWVTNRTMQTGRSKLGLGCRLSGTGFALRRGLLDEVPWKTETEAEDAEYTCMLAECGIKVDFDEYAIVYDEKPNDFKASVNQRRRWAHGIFAVQSEYTFRLIRKLRFNAILGLWEDVLAPLIFAVVFTAALFGKGAVFGEGSAALVTAWVYCLANIAVFVLAVVRDGRLGLKAIPDIFGFIIYILSWIPIGIIGFFGKNTEWYHTKHSKIHK